MLVLGLKFGDQLVAHSMLSGHKKGVPSEFVVAIQEYFGLQFSFSFGHPNIFWRAVLHFGLPFCTWHAAISQPADYMTKFSLQMCFL